MDYGVAFFVFRRPEHTRKVLETIKENGFEKIYVFQDMVKNEKDLPYWKQVEELIKSVDFAEVEFHQAKENKGLANSIVDGINCVLSKHDAVIALEDDVVLAKGYKNFAEQCLEKYKYNKQVMSFCGAGINDQVISGVNIKEDVYFSYDASSFAWGTWKDRWKFYRRDTEYLTKLLSDEQRIKHVNDLVGNYLIEMVKCVYDTPGMIDTWAAFWGLTQAEHNGVCVTPVHALAKAIGIDGSGTNCGTNAEYFESKMSDKVDDFLLPDEIIHNRYLDERIRIVVNNIEYKRRAFKLFIAYLKHKLGML